MDLGGLNESQRQAVQQTEGPLLILAGAGSGKTRTLTHRAAYLVEEKGILPRNILCITFTNKAAAEMRRRIDGLIGFAEDRWVCTFHSMCARILREEAEKLGFTRYFTIYDADDSLRLIKQCLKDLDMNDRFLNPRAVANAISDAKNRMQTPSQMAHENLNDLFKNRSAEVYEVYEQRLQKNNAMDFDNLLLMTVRLFQGNPDILAYYSGRFQYIHIDEYQDTNHAQYLLAKLLATHGNLCVVGDDDQSIYGWRGADIRNILEFERDYPAAKVIRLERNYRSTAEILNCANAVISKNKGRKGKTLWTDRSGGAPVQVYRAPTERGETDYIADEIRKAMDNYRYGDCAVLYRVNAQSRVMEETLMKSGIPYRVLGGMKFYDRKEVKDLIAYLRFIVNPDDDISLLRIINVPRRGIGDTTVERLRNSARRDNLSIYGVLTQAEQYVDRKAMALKLTGFAKAMTLLMAQCMLTTPTDFIRQVVEEVGLVRQYENEGTEEATARAENVMEFLTAADEYFSMRPEADLAGFLENIALVTADEEDQQEEGVTLMTLHSAKGLEFPVVFMMGMEEGLSPHSRSLSDNIGLEEERRLCYVGMTRAMDRLYLTHAVSRGLFGHITHNPPSRFLRDLPEQGVERNDMSFGAVSPFADIQEARRPSFAPIAPPKPKAIQSGDYATGDKVMHPAFGAGTVIAVRNDGGDISCDIAFEKQGIKRIVPKYVAMRKV